MDGINSRWHKRIQVPNQKCPWSTAQDKAHLQSLWTALVMLHRWVKLQKPFSTNYCWRDTNSKNYLTLGSDFVPSLEWLWATSVELIIQFPSIRLCFIILRSKLLAEFVEQKYGFQMEISADKTDKLFPLISRMLEQ